jgi:hypothetical protein
MHPHPDKEHVMSQYRRHILTCKKKWGTARGLIHYRSIVNEYLRCKAHLGILRSEGRQDDR